MLLMVRWKASKQVFRETINKEKSIYVGRFFFVEIGKKRYTVKTYIINFFKNNPYARQSDEDS